ncbi:8136_t:CDS:2 [Diversispora eburnea]|uniref:8136_t:CDS:1 n=1 Tax=Diversispora eburnea TaxID=1213867 RepID=A0A9N9GEZ3_9GLOM|nr:8136_t:CDS:2 [Diversispora eburnea]
MEINIPKGKDRSEELKNFKEEMVKAIKESEVTLRMREENKKKSENDSELNQARTVALQEIEKSMNERGLKEVLGFIISKLVRKESKTKREDNYRLPNNPYQPRGQPKPERVFNRQDEPRGRIEEGRMDNFLGGIQDKTRNKELEEHVQALTLKDTAPQTSRIKQMIFGKEKQLNQSKAVLNLTETQEYQEKYQQYCQNWQERTEIQAQISIRQQYKYDGESYWAKCSFCPNEIRGKKKDKEPLSRNKGVERVRD